MTKINAAKTGLIHTNIDRADGVVASFSIWESGIEFRDNGSIVMELAKFDEIGLNETVDLIQVIPQNINDQAWQVISHNYESIKIGIPNLVEITLSRTSVFNMKANYKIFESIPNNKIYFEIRTEANVDRVVNHRGASLTQGIDHNVDIVDDGIYIATNRGNIFFPKPDNGVSWGIQSGIAYLRIPDDVEYPFEFDPSTTIDDTAMSAGPKGKNILTYSGTRLHTVYRDSNQDAMYSYSDDGGSTWSDVIVNASLNYVHVCLASDSDQNAYIVYSANSGSIWYKKYTYGTGLGSQVTITSAGNDVGQADCDIGPNGYLQVIYHRDTGSGAYRIYHWDAFNTTNLIVSAAYPSIHASIVVDGDNTAHMVFGEGNSSGRNRNLTYRKKVWNTSPATAINVVSHSSNDALFTVDIDINSVGYIYCACQDYDAPQNGTPNVRVWGKTSSGSTFSHLGDMTSSTVHSDSRKVFLGVDRNDILYVLFIDFGGYSTYDVVAYRTYDGTNWTPVTSSAPSILVSESKNHETGAPIHSVMHPPHDGTGIVMFNSTDLDLKWYSDLITNLYNPARDESDAYWFT